MNTFMIIVLGFIAGVTGNLIAGWIQQDLWKNVFKRSRMISTIVVAFVTMVVTVIATHASEKSNNTPGISNELQASPYQNSRIDLLSAVPENSSSLLGGDDIAYSYRVKYYVPQFDWERLGLEPQIIVSAEKDKTLFGETGHILLTIIPAQVGTEYSVELTGRMIVPNDRDNWSIDVYLTFKDEQQKRPRLENFIIPLSYKISQTDYEEAYIELISAKPDPEANGPLVAGDEVEFEFAVKYFVSSFEYKRSGFDPLLTLRMVQGHDEFGRTSASDVLSLEAVVGKVTKYTLRRKLKIPQEQKELELWISVRTDPKYTPLKQTITLKYQIDNE